MDGIRSNDKFACAARSTRQTKKHREEHAWAAPRGRGAPVSDLLRAELFGEVRVGRQQLVLDRVIATPAASWVSEHPRLGPLLRRRSFVNTCLGDRLQRGSWQVRACTECMLRVWRELKVRPRSNGLPVGRGARVCGEARAAVVQRAISACRVTAWCAKREQ